MTDEELPTTDDAKDAAVDAIPQEVVDQVKDEFVSATKEMAHDAASIATDVIVDDVSDALDDAEQTQEGPAPTKEAPTAEPTAKQGLGQNAWIGIACAALVLGLLLGRFVLGGGAASANKSLAGKIAVTEAELDNTFATFTFNGKVEEITIRDAILQSNPLEAVMNEEGNYMLPSAENALAVARNRIIESEAQRRGITVTDEDLATYAEQMLGSSDYSAIAASYGMEEESVKALLRSSALTSLLHDDVVGTTTGVMPAAPDYPMPNPEDEVTEEAMKTPTKGYADYIIGLADDEWDVDAGTWASPDGTYATALAGYEVTPEGATYEAAQTAYYVAYQLYAQSASSGTEQWNAFVNGLLSKSNINISTLVS